MLIPIKFRVCRNLLYVSSILSSMRIDSHHYKKHYEKSSKDIKKHQCKQKNRFIFI